MPHSNRSFAVICREQSGIQLNSLHVARHIATRLPRHDMRLHPTRLEIEQKSKESVVKVSDSKLYIL
jgi:hypothetical protein